MTSILLSVGDASGDRYAADWVRELRELRPDARFRGMGGEALEKAGVHLVVHQRELAVAGVFELIPHLGRITRIWRRMIAELKKNKPDLVVLVDSSGFNLPFARRVRRAGIPVLYYVAPQVWAWRRGRVRKLARRVDRIAVIHPFEPAVYRESGASVEFVGHPLVDLLGEAAPDLERGSARERLGVDPKTILVSLLPGSRRTELRHCLPLFLETARVLHARDVRLHFLLPVAPSIDRSAIEAGIRDARLPSLIRLNLIEGRSLEALAASDIAIIKPGTSTLEAALLGCPMVVAFRGNPMSVALARRLTSMDAVGMPNLIAGARIVPELIQNDADPQRIASAALELLGGSSRARQLKALAGVREQLEVGGAARRAAEIAKELLDARDHS
jgi:lipid-A-disaccharide synthase